MADAEVVPEGEPRGDGGEDDGLWPGPTLDEPGEEKPDQPKGDGAPGVKKWPGPTVDGDGDQ